MYGTFYSVLFRNSPSGCLIFPLKKTVALKSARQLMTLHLITVRKFSFLLLQIHSILFTRCAAWLATGLYSLVQRAHWWFSWGLLINLPYETLSRNSSHSAASTWVKIHEHVRPDWEMCAMTYQVIRLAVSPKNTQKSEELDHFRVSNGRVWRCSVMSSEGWKEHQTLQTPLLDQIVGYVVLVV